MVRSHRMPRVFVIRHGETEWSLSGQHTGLTDLPLTTRGDQRVKELGEQIAGSNKLLDPSKLTHVFVSPRTRARTTFQHVLGAHAIGTTSASVAGKEIKSGEELDSKLCHEWTWSLDDLAREWDYGVCEGKTSDDIHKLLGPDWDIYKDGCPEGDSVESITRRVDSLIHFIRTLHMAWYSSLPSSPCQARQSLSSTSESHPLYENLRKKFSEAGAHHENHEKREGEEDKEKEAHGRLGGDIAIFTHGHFSKVFVTRWAQWDITAARGLVTGAGSVQVCGYQHHMLEEPAIEGLNWYTREL